MKYPAAFLLAILLSGCGGGNRYQVSDGLVFYESPFGVKVVRGADVATFQPLNDGFARDARHVYFTDEVVAGADPATFVALDFSTGRDATSIFRASSRCVECDHASFRRIDKNWYVDRSAAYSALNNGWQRIEGVDAPSFTVLNSGFAKDKNYAYHNAWRVPGADPATFKLGGCGICEICAEDRNSCYWGDHAVPCDCKPHSAGHFPYRRQFISPGKALIVARGMEYALRITSADGVPTTRSFEVELPPGEHTLGFTCPNIDGGATGTVTMKLEAGRTYNLSPQGSICKAELEKYAVVRARDAAPQVRIDNLSREPGGEVPANGVFEGRVEPGHHLFSVTCIDVGREGVREASAIVEIDAQPRHFYEIGARFENDI